MPHTRELPVACCRCQVGPAPSGRFRTQSAAVGYRTNTEQSRRHYQPRHEDPLYLAYIDLFSAILTMPCDMHTFDM